jgi:hypothetical protein
MSSFSEHTDGLDEETGNPSTRETKALLPKQVSQHLLPERKRHLSEFAKFRYQFANEQTLDTRKYQVKVIPAADRTITHLHIGQHNSITK